MIKARLDKFLADRSGGVVIYVAVAMPVLVGGMGLGAETGYRYYNQRLLQHAADVAAYAGAVRMYKETSDANVETAALNVATESGFMPDIGILPVSHVPPTSGAYTGDPSAVEVILTETRPRLFSAIFSEEPVVIAARAVAAVQPGATQAACILALSSTASGAVTVTGSTDINLTGCSVASNSNATDSFNMSGMGSSITTDCVSVVGDATTTTNLTLTECDTVSTKAYAVQDPYYWIMEPDAASIPCQTTYNNGKVGKPNQTTTVTPSHTWAHPGGTVVPVMRFCDGLDAKGVVNFEPGLYIVENGKFTSSGTDAAQINSIAPTTVPTTTTYNNDLPGVTFYFTNGGAVDIGANTTLNLTAPKSGPYSGILFFGSRTDSTAHSIQGSATSVIQGAIYMPASEVTFTGNSSASSGCTQVIATTVVLTGNSSLTSECEASGWEDILMGDLIAVVE